MQTKVNASDVSAARVVCTKHLKWLSQKEPQYTLAFLLHKRNPRGILT